MAELVDAQVSGTCDRFGRGSSSLLQGTIIKTAPPAGLFFIMVKRTCQFASPQQRSEANVTSTLTEAELFCAWISRAKLTKQDQQKGSDGAFLSMVKRPILGIF